MAFGAGRQPSCSKCGRAAPDVEFYVRRSGRRTSECKGCPQRTTSEAYHRAKVTRPRQHLFDRVRYRAKDEGIEFSITLEEAEALVDYMSKGADPGLRLVRKE